MMSHDSTTTAYALMGGEPVLRKLVARFYQLMDELPEAHAIRKLHPRDLSASEEKLCMFLSGWLGGPNLYIERHGHPRLRARHLPFPIASAERDQWLMCMRLAMEESIAEAALRERIYGALADLANHMRNTQDRP